MDVFEQSKSASVKDFRKALKSAGKDVLKRDNAKGQTLIHTAAEGGNHDVLKLLLTKYKLSHYVNIKDSFGAWTPLHYAADGGHLECIELLIPHGADVTATSRDGDTALHYLVRAKSRQPDTVHYYKLLKTILSTRGLDVNVQNSNGEAPLHHAALGGHDEVANLLLNHGADINTKSRIGETALHYAARYGHVDVVKTLLERNADFTLAGSSGTPLNIAVTYQQDAVAELLSAAQGNYKKFSAPVLHSRPAISEEQFASLLPPVTNVGTHSAPMPDMHGRNGHQSAPWPTIGDHSEPAGLNLLQFCRVTVCPRTASSSRGSNPAPSPAMLAAFISQVDAALAARSQRAASLTYEFIYEREILSHIEKEREAFRLAEERRRNGGGGVALGGGSPYTPPPTSMHVPVGGPYSPYNPPPPVHSGMPASPYAGPGPSFAPQMPQPPFLSNGTHGNPFMVPPHSAPSLHSPHQYTGGDGGGTSPLATSDPASRLKNMLSAKQKSGSTGDISRTVLESARSPRGGVPVLPQPPSTDGKGRRSRSSSGGMTSAAKKHSLPLNPVQEKLYLKVISEHEDLNTEHVLIAVRHCGNDPKSVIAYVKAYERIKPIGYSQAHVVEALKAYGGGAAGLSPQAEEQQHQRMLAFLKLLVNKGFSPVAQVQNTLSLFDYDVDKAEKFLSSYKTVSQLGFSDVQVREALLLSDSDSELAIRYLLEGK